MIPTRRKRQKVATEYGFSDRFMQEVSAGMRKYPERYPNATIQDGRCCIIDVEMMLDYIKYRSALDTGVNVPAFNREDYQR